MHNREKYTEYLHEFTINQIKTSIINRIDFNVGGQSPTIINAHKETFANLFYDFWYFHQINGYDFDEFVIRCKRVIGEWGEWYNFMINKIDISNIIPASIIENLGETHRITSNINKNVTKQDTNSEIYTTNNELKQDEDITKNRKTNENERFLDTPQTPLENELYATNITKIDNEYDDTIKTIKNDSDKKNETKSGSKNGSESTTSNDIKTLEKTYNNLTLDEIYDKIEKVYRNFDILFIKKFDNCFLKVF